MEKTEYQKWLENLQVGDEVYYAAGRFWGGKIARVKRFTPTRMIGLSDGTMVNKDGSIRGDKFLYIHPVTQRHRDEIERKRLLSKAREIDFSELSLDQLREIVRISEEQHRK